MTISHHGTHLGRDRPIASEVGTRLVGAMTEIPSLIRQMNCEPLSILEEAEVSPETLSRPQNRIAHDVVIRLLNIASNRTACPHFGLIVGRAWALSHLGLLGDLMANSPTVGASLQELVLFQHLNSDAAVAFMLKGEVVTELGYTFYMPLVDDTSQFYAAVLAAATNFIRELCGPDWSPSEVLFPYTEPGNVDPYLMHFRAPVHFNSTRCALRLPTRNLKERVRNAKAESLQVARCRAREIGRNSIIDTVSRTIRTLLLHGISSGDDVARSLSMQRRTLNRRLRSENVTFQELLDRVRYAVARELIQSSDVPLSNISRALGYADTESFFRAYRRWTGETPDALRTTARAKCV